MHKQHMFKHLSSSHVSDLSKSLNKFFFFFFFLLPVAGTALNQTFQNYNSSGSTYVNYRVCPFSDTIMYCGPQCEGLSRAENCSYFDASNITKCNCGTWTFSADTAGINQEPAQVDVVGGVRWDPELGVAGQGANGPGAGIVTPNNNFLLVNFAEPVYLNGVETKGVCMCMCCVCVVLCCVVCVCVCVCGVCVFVHEFILIMQFRVSILAQETLGHRVLILLSVLLHKYRHTITRCTS
jgi:hypothetical protein